MATAGLFLFCWAWRNAFPLALLNAAEGEPRCLPWGNLQRELSRAASTARPFLWRRSRVTTKSAWPLHSVPRAHTRAGPALKLVLLEKRR